MTIHDSPFPARLKDLFDFEGKAELVGGRVVELMPTSRIHNRVAGRIFKSLDDRALQLGIGEAYTDNIGFTLPAPIASGRESFSPDASYFRGPFTSDPKKFIDGTPTFAVEVRSDSDSGPAGARAMAEKRDDYFEAGTLVVWDVDPDAETIFSGSSDKCVLCQVDRVNA